MGRKVYENVFGDRLMSATEAAYFAGFTDGEGTITLTRSPRPNGRAGFRFYPMLAVAQCEIDVLLWLRQVSGNGRIVNASRTGHNSRPLHRLEFSPNQIRHVLPQLMPYLKVKARQAVLLMEYLATTLDWRNHQRPVNWQRVEEIRNEFRRLNPRGLGPRQALDPLTIRPSRSGNNQWQKLHA